MGRMCLFFYWKLGNNLCYVGIYQNKAHSQHPRKTDVIQQRNILCPQQACLRDCAFTQHKFMVPCSVLSPVPGSGPRSGPAFWEPALRQGPLKTNAKLMRVGHLRMS